MGNLVGRVRGALRERSARRTARRRERAARAHSADAELRRTGASGRPPDSIYGATGPGGPGSFGGEGGG